MESGTHYLSKRSLPLLFYGTMMVRCKFRSISNALELSILLEGKLLESIALNNVHSTHQE